MDDAKRYQIGVVRKSSSAEYLIKSGFTEKKNLQFTSIEIQNIRKLVAGRIDLVPFNNAEMAWHLKKLNPPAKMQMAEPVYLMSGGSHYFIALSKQVSNAILVKLQTALDQMKQDGRYKKLYRKYM